MTNVLLIALELNRGPALQVALAKLRVTLDDGLFDLTTITQEEIERNCEADIQHKIHAADLILASHILSEDCVERIVRALDSHPRAYQFLPFSSSGKLMRLMRIDKFSLATKEKPEREKSDNSGMSKMRELLLRIVDEDDLVHRLKELIALVPKVLKLLPGRAQGIRYYLEAYLAWLEPTAANTDSLLRILLRLTRSEFATLEYVVPSSAISEAIYYPDAPKLFESTSDFLNWRPRKHTTAVGILLLRTNVISGDTAYIDELIRIFDAVGCDVLPVFSETFDARKVIEEYWRSKAGVALVDAVVSLTGFPLVGGHVRSVSEKASEALHMLNVPYYSTVTLTHQSLSEWEQSRQGLSPVQVATNIALTELDGAIEPIVIASSDGANGKQLIPANAQLLVNRVAKRLELKHKPNSDKRVALVVFCFPPARGAVGTAAYLDVFESAFRLITRMKSEGYTIDLPADSRELLRAVLGEGETHAASSTHLNVCAKIPKREYERLVPRWREIANEWGEPPGEINSDGESLLVQGKHFGNLFIGVQPGFGYEGDPMRLLFAKNATPHHGFAAFYAYLNHIWKADAVLHFGTHGALEFMPGKHAGLSDTCWPQTLIGDVPNLYLYSVNNPSEAAIAKRRSYATLISYLAPSSVRAGSYKSLAELRSLIQDYQSLSDDAPKNKRDALTELILEKGSECHLAPRAGDPIRSIDKQLQEIESRLIPLGLRTINEGVDPATLQDMLEEMAAFARPELGLESLHDLLAFDNFESNFSQLADEAQKAIRLTVSEIISALVTPSDVRIRGLSKKYSKTRATESKYRKMLEFIVDVAARAQATNEIEPIIRALRGEFIEPGPGGDVLRVPKSLPAGRNITSLNPNAIPSALAVRLAKQTVAQLLTRSRAASGSAYPECIGMVLWGLDNIKTAGEAVAQAFYLLGVEIEPDALGNMTRIRVIPIKELGRPRIDCVFTVSGIFRDLFGLQMELLDEAVRMVASLNETDEENFVRKHKRELVAGGMNEGEAAFRVFSNASGSYGTNVDYMVMSGNWEEQKDLAGIFSKRKGFAFGKRREVARAPEVLRALSKYIDVTFQNLDSSEIGISDVDHYYEYLGGITNLATVSRGKAPNAFVADTTTAYGVVRTLEETVQLEAQTKLLNPKWYEGMLKHGFEGVEEIKKRVDYNYGWSATANAVPSWFYDEVFENFVGDDAMRDRMQSANADSFRGMLERLSEANARGFWSASQDKLEKLGNVTDELEDEMEGIVYAIESEE
jgi:magnesium chelatase subunit H